MKCRHLALVFCCNDKILHNGDLDSNIKVFIVSITWPNLFYYKALSMAVHVVLMLQTVMSYIIKRSNLGSSQPHNDYNRLSSCQVNDPCTTYMHYTWQQSNVGDSITYASLPVSTINHTNCSHELLHTRRDYSAV